MGGNVFKMGWMLVIFDLPVQTKAQRHAATNFRKSLLDEGYSMIQYSVYARGIVSYDRMRTHSRRIKGLIPAEGHVRVLYVTEAQWERMYIMFGTPSKPKKPEKLPEQMLLW